MLLLTLAAVVFAYWHYQRDSPSRIQISTSHIDLGEIRLQKRSDATVFGRATRLIAITNRGRSTLRVNVPVSLSNLYVRVPQRTIGPGEFDQMEIDVLVGAGQSDKHFLRTFELQTNDPSQPVIRFTVEAKMMPLKPR